ncbi:glyoxalase [Microbulbifer sp. A4B17]|uniref:VOC family protein n=1 Tax=Microbulbifer sp. A4B17 TaxID=359370 RepID=UPI000D52C14C|nr:VOC family protein [Microbulbifer sp. A4B17]AWF83006.1 glyoxalase [Microbulbifer sp. A4B17]
MQILLNIDVDDLSRGSNFYCDAFGLHEGRRLGTDVVEILGGSIPIFLKQRDPGAWPINSKKNINSYDRHWTPVHMDVVVEELLLAIERVVDTGGQMNGNIQKRKWGIKASLSDPFGNSYYLMQFNKGGSAAADL